MSVLCRPRHDAKSGGWMAFLRNSDHREWSRSRDAQQSRHEIIMNKLSPLGSAIESGDAITRLCQLVILLLVLQNSVNSHNTSELQPTSTKHPTGSTVGERFYNLAKRIRKKGEELGKIVNKTEIRGTVPGKAGVDYPNYSYIPSTAFTCSGRPTGYYADVASRCQVFHVCYSARRITKQSFLCPNGTVFNQRMNICEWWTKVDCRNSIASANFRLNNDARSAVDTISSQTVTTETHSQLVPKRNESKFCNTKTNSVTEAINQRAMKFLLDNLFLNLSENRISQQSTGKNDNVQTIRSLPKRERGTVTNDLNTNEHELQLTTNQNSFSNYSSNMKTLLPVIKSGRLSAIDKLIYSASPEANNSEIGTLHLLPHSNFDRNSGTFDSHNIEILPSLTKGMFNLSETGIPNDIITLLNLLPHVHKGNTSDNNNTSQMNLNIGFVKQKAPFDRFHPNNSENISNGGRELTNEIDLIRKPNLTQYGIYYLSNEYNGTSGHYTPLVKDRRDSINIDAFYSNKSSQSDALSDRFRKNNNYNGYGSIRQNIVMPSVPKISDILTGFHDLSVQTIMDIGNSSTVSNRPPTKSTKEEAGLTANYDNTLKYNFNPKHTEQLFKNNKANLTFGSAQEYKDVYKPFEQLKESARNTARVSTVPGKPERRQTEPQVEITQRPVYRLKNNATSFNNNKKVINVKLGNNYSYNVFNKTSRLNDTALLGSTDLQGVDLITTTSDYYDKRNYINGLQDGLGAKAVRFQPQMIQEELKQVVTAWPQNTGQSYNVTPVSKESVQNNRPTNERYWGARHRPKPFNSNQQPDSVVILPSLGFSLNSDDDIKAFNQAISAGLLNENG